jgi:NTP pyrophosphatase (non-canonical NTP hydrolase)
MAMLGLCGEAGEVADHFKKWKFHGHAIDMDKLSSEIGDVMWYVAELCSALDLSLDEVAASNIAKLKLRYGEAFSSEKSINRSE